MRLAFSLQTVLSSLMHDCVSAQCLAGRVTRFAGLAGKEVWGCLWLGQESLFEQPSLGTRYNMTIL